MIAASKSNKGAMAYFALAFKTMKLLSLITNAKTLEWTDGGGGVESKEIHVKKV
jgi:hypothetical protein